MQSWKLLIAIASFYIFVQSGCSGGANGCGQELPYDGKELMTISITTDIAVFHKSAPFSVTLIKPSIIYNKPQVLEENEFPLLINTNEMSFLITKTGGGIDTMTIQYEVVPYFYEGVCNDPYYLPKASIKSCFSRNYLFKVVSYGLK